ncbi:hypothetical protein SAMN04487846_0789 [Microbacterium sp. cf046]|uniref:hypothetical protein n=1 Tax=Microbacterium sp. cf046 TaxID=1761803 RepID=UPI0008F0E017|nr:hypothetical protein [Microbacterium sp. cf046]SFR93364.1 hypothetical protein SAMN04487846_0789 [Microbacterium sp. cf046]
MGKIYGLHSLELRPGVAGDEFERFLASDAGRLPALPGWRIALLRGERGDHVGEYLALVEIDSVEARDRVSPNGGFDDTAEGRAWLAVAGPILERWLGYVVHLPGVDAPYTDYQEVVD